MLVGLALAALLLILSGATRLVLAWHAAMQRRIDAQYRAAALVIESRRIVRAAKHRAQEREWGRAA